MQKASMEQNRFNQTPPTIGISVRLAETPDEIRAAQKLRYQVFAQELGADIQNEEGLDIETVHAPYHAALARLVGEAHSAHGYAILIDWHSMPAAAARIGGRAGGCDIVLGDRFGAACASQVTARDEQMLEALGYRVARNAPYAGGYTTEHYGRPARRTHALQIEINRALYLDEETLQPTAGFARLRDDLEDLTARLAAMDWSDLRN